MAIRLWQSFFGSVPAKFASAHSVDDSLQRLQDSSFRSWRDATLYLKESAVGTATPSGVSLRHFVPVNGRGVRAQFRGTVLERSGSVSLEGIYTLPLSYSVGMLAFVAIALSLVAATGFDVIRDLSTWQSSMGELVLVFLAVALPIHVHYLYRKDIDWMNEYFRGVLV
jgi:hypothetical protein